MENFNAQEAAEKIIESVKEEYEKLTTVNVMILGKSGVGKSTLINNMFNERLAETGIGRPITQGIRKITKPGLPLAIYDTPGLELSGTNSFDSLLESVTAEIERTVQIGDLSEAIHCIWYCVNATSNRFEQAEIDFIKGLQGRNAKYEIPVIIILTQAYQKSNVAKLKQEIEKENLPVSRVHPVLAENCPIDEDYTVKAYGLDTLAQIMNNVLPQGVQKTFLSIQKANLEMKKAKAHAEVSSAALIALGTGAIPIPFSDAAILVPNQIKMLSAITATFGLPIDKAILTAVISATIGSTGATVLGKAVVSNLLKIIPGVGTVISSTISGGTAAALTAALGETYIAVMVMICKGERKAEYLNTAKGRKEMNEIFKENLKAKRTDMGDRI